MSARRSSRPPSVAPAADARFWLVCAALYALIVVLLWPSLDFGPISLDDYSELQRLAKGSIHQIWGPDNYGHFRPLKNLLFWLLGRSKENWAPWRTTILCAQLVATAMVQRLAAHVSGSRWTGIAAAAFWAIHPTTASVTCWFSTCNVMVSLMGMLLYLYFADLALDLGAGGSSAPARRSLVFGLAGLSIALLGHELALAAPLLLFAYEKICGGVRRGGYGRVVYVSSGVCAAVYLALTLANVGGRGAYRFQSEPVWLIVASAARYMGQNTLLWVWPFGNFGVLLVDQPAQHVAQSGVWWVALLASCWMSWRLRRRDPALTFGLVWFAVLLAPVANFVPIGNTPVAVHYLYLPGVGLAVALSRSAGLMTEWVGRVTPGPMAALVPALSVALGISWLPETRRVVTAWGDEEQLFRMTVENHPDNVEAMVNLSSVYLRQRQLDQAQGILEKARNLAPDDTGVVHNTFSLLSQTERFDAALALLDQHPASARLPDLLVGRGFVLERLERHEEAATAFQDAFDSAGGAADAETRFAAGYHLAIALLETGRHAEAERLVERLLVDYPDRQELILARRLLRE